MTQTLGFDIGGTSIKVARFSEAEGLVGRFRVSTPTGDPSGALLARTVADLLKRERSSGAVGAVGIAAPGVVDLDREIIVSSVNLGLENVALGDLLRSYLDLPFVMGHDIRAGALAEATYGALRNVDGTAIFAAVGTGVSLAVVRDGEVDSGAPWAGEIGQVLVEASNGDTGRVRLETVASASGIATNAGVSSGERAAEAAARGEEQARDAWALGIEALGEALAWSSAVLGADRIVIGGGLASAGRALFSPLTRAINERLPLHRRPSMRAAELGEFAGCVGAGMLALRAVTGHR